MSDRLTAEQVGELEGPASRLARGVGDMNDMEKMVRHLPSLLATAKREAEQTAEIERLNTRVGELEAQLTAGPDKVLRCAFCGHAYPDGTPDHKHQILADHVRVCPVHPIGQENRRLREALEKIADAPACGPDGSLYYEMQSEDGQVGAMHVDPLGWIGSAADAARTALGKEERHDTRTPQQREADSLDRSLDYQQ